MRKLIPCPFCDGNTSDYNPCTVCDGKGVRYCDDELLKEYGEAILASLDSIYGTDSESHV